MVLSPGKPVAKIRADGSLYIFYPWGRVARDDNNKKSVTAVRIFLVKAYKENDSRV
jgi:hypothetical protein